MTKLLLVILILCTCVLVDTIAHMPDPYLYGRCPDSHHRTKVQTYCAPNTVDFAGTR